MEKHGAGGQHFEDGQDLSRQKTGIRGAIRKFVLMVIIFFVWLTKPFKFLHQFYPYKIRELAKAWDSEMIWLFLLSGGKKIHFDQNCTLPDPPSFKPLIQTKPEWQFTEEQIKQFYRDGFIAPITLWTAEEMVEVRRKVDSVLDRKSGVYPKVENNLRDRYIDAPEFWEVISAPQIVERLAQLLGPDLMVWRSQIFNKKAGGPEVTWHQASTYMAEQRFKAAVEPPDLNKLFQLTTWIAIDDADFENGCMHFVRGTHRKIWPAAKSPKGYYGNPPELYKQVAGAGQFAKSMGIAIEVDVKEEDMICVPLKSGQCVIFTERCIHGSPPNKSNRRRFGFVFRTIQTNVHVYRGETDHSVTYLKENYQLDNWGCALLRGEDKYHLNKMITPPAYGKEKVVAETVSA
jgi:non-heme Fe2+,alpha-ketoglutarate-dependent halogenase